MSDAVDYDKLARRARKKRIMAPDQGVELGLGVEAVERILPHRPPMRLVDGIDRLDLDGRVIAGHVDMRPDDPVFAGHFPDYPVYPGLMQLEALGQLSICLTWFLHREATDVPVDATPLDVRALKVLHGQFIDEVRPGDRCTLLAQSLTSDEFGGISLGQMLVGDRICSVTVGEFYLPMS